MILKQKNLEAHNSFNNIKQNLFISKYLLI